MNKSQVILSVDKLCVEIDDVQILSNISFEVEAGQLVHIKGGNGVGKTTLLRTLVGMSAKSQGNINVSLERGRGDIGYVGHKLAIEQNLTVEENIKVAMLGESEHEDITSLLQKLYLPAHRYHYPDQLSQGQKKRVSLARFFALSRKLWLLDEPFNALDLTFQQYLKQAMIDFIQGGGSIMLTSHLDLTFEEVNFQEVLL